MRPEGEVLIQHADLFPGVILPPVDLREHQVRDLVRRIGLDGSLQVTDRLGWIASRHPRLGPGLIRREVRGVHLDGQIEDLRGLPVHALQVSVEAEPGRKLTVARKGLPRFRDQRERFIQKLGRLLLRAGAQIRQT